MAYLIDTSVFIEAKNRYYSFDVCPGFWDWLKKSHARRSVFSIEKVGDELGVGADELAQWATQRGNSFFLPPDDAVLGALPKVSEWIANQRFNPAAVSTFLQGADYFLVAHALAHRFVVVTQEIAGTSKSKLKIPDPCIGLGIKVVNVHAMLKTERARFVLEES